MKSEYTYNIDLARSPEAATPTIIIFLDHKGASTPIILGATTPTIRSRNIDLQSHLSLEVYNNNTMNKGVIFS